MVFLYSHENDKVGVIYYHMYVQTISKVNLIDSKGIQPKTRKNIFIFFASLFIYIYFLMLAPPRGALFSYSFLNFTHGTITGFMYTE